MRDLHRHTGLTADSDRLGDGLQQRLPLSTDVRGVQPFVAGDDPAQGNDLLGAGVTTGRIDQSCGQPKGPRPQPFVEVRLHPAQLGRGWLALLEPHYRDAQCPMSDQGHKVDRHAASFEHFQVLAKGPPVPGSAVAPPRPRLGPTAGAPRPDGPRPPGRGHAAVSNDLGGHPWRNHTLAWRFTRIDRSEWVWAAGLFGDAWMDIREAVLNLVYRPLNTHPWLTQAIADGHRIHAWGPERAQLLLRSERRAASQLIDCGDFKERGRLVADLAVIERELKLVLLGHRTGG